MNDDWKKRLTDDLEPELKKRDPRPAISAYHDMPYAIFRYEPASEFALREELSLLVTRLESAEWRESPIPRPDPGNCRIHDP